MEKDDQQQELDIDLGDQVNDDQPVEKAETFGERIDRNIKGNSAVPKDPDTHSEGAYSESDDLAEWYLRHKDQENP